VTRASFLASTALTGVLAYPAMAADMPLKAPPLLPPAIPQALTWTGLYVGVNGGYAWGHSATSCSFVAGIDSACEGIALPNSNPKGGLLGVELGADWQYQNWVFGLAGDFNWLHLRDAVQFPSEDQGKTDQLSSRYDWLGTVRARAGMSFGQSLFYGTGGVAFGRVEDQYIHDTTGVNKTQFFSSSDTLVGWTAGAGWEYIFTRNWIFKLEYLHVDLGKSNLDISSAGTSNPPGSTVLHFANTLEIIRAGLKLKF
jgi:outer membrane immunogenic protein